MLEVLRELPNLDSELLEVASFGGRACTYLSPWEGKRGVSVCAETAGGVIGGSAENLAGNARICV